MPSSPDYLTIMPSFDEGFPLEPGVPVEDLTDPGRKGTTILDHTILHVYDHDANQVVGPIDSDPTYRWVVDLSTAGGLGFALRYWLQRSVVDPFAHPPTRFDLYGLIILRRHVQGSTTDADRLALATACREVLDGS